MPPTITSEPPPRTEASTAASGSRAIVHPTVSRGIITVCHPVWRLGCGGLERQLMQTVERLPRDTFRHVLVVRGWDSGSARGEEELGKNVYIVRQPAQKKDRLWPVRLASILREHSVDVLHVRGLTMVVDAMIAARSCGGVATAFSFHGFETTGQSLGLLRRRIYRAAVAVCDDRWAVSRAAAQAIAERLRMDPEQFGILPNGVDTGHYAPTPHRSEVRRRLRLPPDRAVILSVGNLKPVKGHADLLEAMALLRGRAAPATLVLVGRDHMEGALQNWTREHLSDADIRFVGEEVSALPWYQAADVFVLPSRWEGMSNAVLEAMACGLPVVATAVGGNLEVVCDDRTGRLVQPEHPEQLCNAIGSLLSDAGARERLGGAARAHVTAHFGASLATARYENRCRRLAQRHVRHLDETHPGQGDTFDDDLCRHG